MMREPGQGLRYWQNWSLVLTAGNWDPRTAWRTEKEMMLAGNFAILGILAHEMGHAADYSYELSEWRASRPQDSLHQAIREAVADELAVAVLRQLATADARFAGLLDGYRKWTAGSLRKSAPADRQWGIGKLTDLITYAAAHPAPAEKDLYVSYQLARQEWLIQWKGLPAWVNSLRNYTRKYEQAFEQNCRRSPESWSVASITEMPARQAKPSWSLDMPPFRTQQGWSWWQINWLRDPARDTTIFLQSEADTARGKWLNLQPLLNWGRAQGIPFPSRHSAAHNWEYYIWDIWPADSLCYRVLLSDNRKFYFSGTRPPLSRIWLLEYRPGQEPAVLATDSLVFTEIQQLAAAARQQADGEWRIYSFRQQGNDESGFYEQYKITANGKAERLFATRAWHKTAGGEADGHIDSVQLDWYRVIRQSLPGPGGTLIFGQNSRLRLLSPLQVETLAGERLPGARDGDARGQVCNQPIPFRVLPEGSVIFWNKQPFVQQAGEGGWRLKKLEKQP